MVQKTKSTPLIVIVGPTASGKSALGLEVARRFNGEIICADSQTIRQDMDVGTAKPIEEDQKLIRHHLLDIIGPYDNYSAAQFKRDALAAIDDISGRKKLPVIVGGTGLYVDSIIYNFNFANAPSPEQRAELDSKSVEELQRLHEDQGVTLPFNNMNKRHLVRSLESGGLKALDKTLRENTLVIGLDMTREELDKRIEARVDAMLAGGFLEEVRKIVETHGYPPKVWDAIGYKVALKWLDEGDLDRAEYVRQALITATRQYAKRQRGWFGRNKYIHWLSTPEEAYVLAEQFLTKRVSS